MPVKIRLQRHGRKGRPYYHIVVADSRAPRDGKYIERLGIYNPITNPATIEINFDKALQWLLNGAQPTDTTRTILKNEGIIFKKHLLEGVKKGAFDESQAETKFQTWLKEKRSKIEAKKDKLGKESDKDLAQRLDAESKANEKRAEAIAKKNAKIAADARAAKEVPAEDAEEVVPEVVAEVAAPEVVAEVAAPEVVAEEAAPEVVAEEAPAQDQTAENTQVEETKPEE
ncbi:MAG: 30S ribosomal protein S16 [Bacteroidetes bacterium GWF2_38_335]|nr:MAG: 30S ribosomal protein S16 [Bacteroidetes bacterium GWF2_38_335]OFY81076.1 MAG: 30S ribosomal protein S16 [Bacteroidetes bacterium RIFOXYA12_FULL_38_20]HBS87605.1 30S ribosomal protein S16 [Bacteroidales bacterium]